MWEEYGILALEQTWKLPGGGGGGEFDNDDCIDGWLVGLKWWYLDRDDAKGVVRVHVATICMRPQ